MTDKIKAAVSLPWVSVVHQLTTLVLLPWAVWVTSNTYEARAFQAQGDRFSQSDALRLERTLLAALYEAEQRTDQRIDSLPPREFREAVDRLQAEQRTLARDLKVFETEFSRDFVRKNELAN